MLSIKRTLHTPALALLLALAAPAWSQQAPANQASQGAVAQPTSADMADGEVRKVDKDAKKLTIRHGEIKRLDMPPMTMVFQVEDAALLDKVKVGDKIRFVARKAGSAYVVTELQTVQ